MDSLEIKGRGIFVFSDPGGAKPLLAYINMRNLQSVMIVSDRVYTFYNEFELTVNQETPGSADICIDKYQPDYVFTGTSYTSVLELKFIEAAQKRGILSMSYIDHSTQIRERFELDGHILLPDYFLVPSEEIRQLAIKEKLDDSRITVIGNPYHDYLKNWKPLITKEQFIRAAAIPPNKKIVLYVPDPLSNVNGMKKYGFDEVMMTAEVSRLAQSLWSQYVFLFKPHPNQQIDRVKHLLHENFRLLTDELITTNEMLYFTDFVLGFFSNILAEAELFGKNVIRLMPSAPHLDPFVDKSYLTYTDIIALEKYLTQQ